MEFKEEKFKPPSNREHLYQQVLEQSDVCDVIIKVGEWKKRFHWCVLTISPFFESLRRNDFIEKLTGVITITANSTLAVETSILFLYGKKPKLTEENVADILDLSEFFMIPNLKCACVRFLRDVSIKDENCMKMLDLSNLYNVELMKCTDYIIGHLQEVLKKKEARRLTKESVIDLLTDPLLTFVNGEEKFHFLVNWAKEFQRNEIAFPEVFDSVDLGDVSPEFWETCVVNHTLVVNMIENMPNFNNRTLLEDHRVLIFTGLSESNRIACFDLEREKWYVLDTTFPDHLETPRSYWNCPVKSARNDKHPEIYRVQRNASSYGHPTVYKQDLRSMNATESRISVLNHDGTISDLIIADETCVGVWNENKSREFELTLLSHLLARRSIERDHFIKSYSTVVYGKLQYPETTAEPILTILNARVTKLCMNNHNLIGLLTDDVKTLYIYNISTCVLDTINVESATYTDQRITSYEAKLTATDDGFFLNDKNYVLSISRLHGPALVDKYNVQHVAFGTDPTWNKIRYFYSTNTWFRVLKKSWNDDVEFASMSHQSLVKRNGKDLAWKPLPATRMINTLLSNENNMFMIRLPKSVLKCHFDCPHCKQQEQDNVALRRHVTERYMFIDDDYLYDDSEDEDYHVTHYMYDSYDDDDF